MQWIKSPRKIANKIIILVLGLELFSISIWGTFTYKGSEKELLNTISSQLSEAAFRTQGEISNFFVPVNVHTQLIGDSLGQQLNSTNNQILFNNFLNSREEIQEFSVSNAKQIEIYRLSRSQVFDQSDLRKLDEPIITQAIHEGRATGNIRFSRYFEPIIPLAIATKASVADQQLVFLIQINLKWLWDILQNQHIGETGYAYVVDEQFRLIGHYDPSLVLGEINVSQTSIPLSLFKDSGQRQLRIYSNFYGKEVAGVSQYDSKNNWWVVVEQPVEEGLLPLHRVIQRFIIVFILAAIFTITLVWFFSRITMRPLGEFENSIDKIAQGEKNVRVTVPANTELDSFARAFNHMAQSLDQRISQLSEAEEKYRTLIETASDAILVCDFQTDQIILTNKQAEQLLKQSQNILLELRFSDLLPNQEQKKKWRSLHHKLRSLSTVYNIDLRIRHENSPIIPVELSAAMAAINGRRIVQIALRDVSERLAHLRQLEYQANHDELTGLPNRKLLYQHAAYSLRNQSDTDSIKALVLFDLDRFKEVNDTLGHKAGDALLKQIGPRLQNLLSDQLLTRLGGDEFAIFCDKTQSLESVVQLCKHILKAMRQHFELDGLQVQINCSIGIAYYPFHGEDLSTLLKHADVAMYYAKANNLGYCIYDEEIDEHSRDKLALLADLEYAIDKNQFFLEYQPKIDIKHSRILSLEALIRWQHPRFGLLPPQHFIPVAEISNHIHAMTFWVFDQALGFLAQCRNEGLNIAMAVNLSPLNLNDKQLVSKIKGLLKKHGLQANNLEIELTETSMLKNLTIVETVINEMHEMGITISLDDYGSSFASLSHLRRFPLDEIKLDRSLVQNIDSSFSNAAIIRSTTELARYLGLRVVAEGVQTRGACQQLLNLGCDVAQSFLFTKPLPPDEILTWCLAHNNQSSLNISTPHLVP